MISKEEGKAEKAAEENIWSTPMFLKLYMCITFPDPQKKKSAKSLLKKKIFISAL